MLRDKKQKYHERQYWLSYFFLIKREHIDVKFVLLTRKSSSANEIAIDYVTNSDIKVS